MWYALLRGVYYYSIDHAAEQTARNSRKEMKLRCDLVSYCFFNVLSSLNYTDE